MNLRDVFVDLPDDPPLALAWPTLNHHLFDQPEQFFARTRANPDYGRPGWTRDCGRRFHRGIDIAPAQPRPTGRTTRVMFSDCASGEEYASDEPVFDVDEPVFAVFHGEIVTAVNDPETSTYGAHTIIRHARPGDAGVFYSLYAHLRLLEVTTGETVARGQSIGRMGQTSSSADARNWMLIAPHLHLEFLDAHKRNYNPEAMLRAFAGRLNSDAVQPGHAFDVKGLGK